MKTYMLLADLPAIKCLVCGRTSNHPDDVKNLYCGYCHEFHEIREQLKRANQESNSAHTRGG